MASMPQVSPELEQLITRLREAKTELRDRFGGSCQELCVRVCVRGAYRS